MNNENIIEWTYIRQDYTENVIWIDAIAKSNIKVIVKDKRSVHIYYINDVD